MSAPDARQAISDDSATPEQLRAVALEVTETHDRLTALSGGHPDLQARHAAASAAFDELMAALLAEDTTAP